MELTELSTLEVSTQVLYLSEETFCQIVAKKNSAICLNKGNEFEDRDNDDDENEDEEDFDECETISDDSVQLPEEMTAEERDVCHLQIMKRSRRRTRTSVG